MARRDHKLDSRAAANQHLAYLYTWLEYHKDQAVDAAMVMAQVQAASSSPSNIKWALPPGWRARYDAILAELNASIQLDLFPEET